MTRRPARVASSPYPAERHAEILPRPMPKGGWLQPGKRRPAPVRRYTPEEIARWLAERGEPGR